MFEGREHHERILKKGYDIFQKVIREHQYLTLVEGITAVVNYRKRIKEKN
jgi:hypothetical protein